jgi:hypothetical protein
MQCARQFFSQPMIVESPQILRMRTLIPGSITSSFRLNSAGSNVRSTMGSLKDSGLSRWSQERTTLWASALLGQWAAVGYRLVPCDYAALAGVYIHFVLDRILDAEEGLLSGNGILKTGNSLSPWTNQKPPLKNEHAYRSATNYAEISHEWWRSLIRPHDAFGTGWWLNVGFRVGVLAWTASVWGQEQINRTASWY